MEDTEQEEQNLLDTMLFAANALCQPYTTPLQTQTSRQPRQQRAKPRFKDELQSIKNTKDELQRIKNNKDELQRIKNKNSRPIVQPVGNDDNDDDNNDDNNDDSIIGGLPNNNKAMSRNESQVVDQAKRQESMSTFNAAARRYARFVKLMNPSAALKDFHYHLLNPSIVHAHRISVLQRLSCKGSLQNMATRALNTAYADWELLQTWQSQIASMRPQNLRALFGSL